MTASSAAPASAASRIRLCLRLSNATSRLMRASSEVPYTLLRSLLSSEDVIPGLKWCSCSMPGGEPSSPALFLPQTQTQTLFYLSVCRRTRNQYETAMNVHKRYTLKTGRNVVKNSFYRSLQSDGTSWKTRLDS